MFDWFKPSLVYILLNSLVPGTDILTDMLTATDLAKAEHTKWSILTVVLIFLPFLLKLIQFLKDLLSRQKITASHGFGLVLHLPFLSPLFHLIVGCSLLFRDISDHRSSATTEKIKTVATLGSLYESFLEAGPQMVLQLHVIFSTGTVSITQLVSIAISMFTLTLAASRAFFIQRDADSADPDPSLQMLLRIFPWMLSLVVSSLLMWTVICLIKEWIVLVFLVSVAITYSTIWVLENGKQNCWLPVPSSLPTINTTSTAT